jgi:hypothetical protein
VLEDRSSVIEGRVSQEPKSAPFDQQRRAADERQSQLIVSHAEPSLSCRGQCGLVTEEKVAQVCAGFPVSC